MMKGTITLLGSQHLFAQIICNTLEGATWKACLTAGTNKSTEKTAAPTPLKPTS